MSKSKIDKKNDNPKKRAKSKGAEVDFGAFIMPKFSSSKQGFYQDDKLVVFWEQGLQHMENSLEHIL